MLRYLQYLSNKKHVLLFKSSSSFNDMNNLTPSSFFNRKGINQSAEIYKNCRPSNVCHFGIRVVVSMSNMSETFDKCLEFSTNYFLSVS